MAFKKIGIDKRRYYFTNSGKRISKRQFQSIHKSVISREINKYGIKRITTATGKAFYYSRKTGKRISGERHKRYIRERKLKRKIRERISLEKDNRLFIVKYMMFGSKKMTGKAFTNPIKHTKLFQIRTGVTKLKHEFKIITGLFKGYEIDRWLKYYKNRLPKGWDFSGSVQLVSSDTTYSEKKGIEGTVYKMSNLQEWSSSEGEREFEKLYDTWKQEIEDMEAEGGSDVE